MTIFFIDKGISHLRRGVEQSSLDLQHGSGLGNLGALE